MASICVFGTWHQASILGPCLAELGHTVVGISATPSDLDSLASGQPPVYEPRLPELLARHLADGSLRYDVDVRSAVDGSDFVLISLDTPVGPDDVPIVEPVFDAVRQVALGARGRKVLVVTAQVPVGTCDRLLALAQRAGSGASWSIAYVPEFLRLGIAVDLFLRPDRIVIGSDDPGVSDSVAEIYAGIPAPIVRVGLRTAEMVKHASNAFLALSVSFINEIANLCEVSGADAPAVAAAMKLDRRIGARAFLSPGLGFAGGTLGRDVRALQALGARSGIETRLLDSTMDVNAARGALVLDRLRASLGELSGRTVCLLGLTYKPGTSALRRSASLELAEALIAAGAGVAAHDPMVPTSRASELPTGLVVVDDVYAALAKADAAVLMTEWSDYTDLDWSRVAADSPRMLVLDARNALDQGAVTAPGLRYWGIGRMSPGQEGL